MLPAHRTSGWILALFPPVVLFIARIDQQVSVAALELLLHFAREIDSPAPSDALRGACVQGTTGIASSDFDLPIDSKSKGKAISKNGRRGKWAAAIASNELTNIPVERIGVFAEH
jgi:hypothetical protein